MNYDQKKLPAYSQIENLHHELKSTDTRYQESMNMMFNDIQHFEWLKKKESKPKVRILNDLSSGIIDIETLSKVIYGLQRIFTGAYNAINGNGSNLGKIPDSVKDKSKLLVTGFSQGSFIVELDSLETLRKESDISLLENNFDEIELLDDLIKKVDSLDGYEDLTTFVEKYGSRTFNYTREWLRDLSSQDIELEFINKNYGDNAYFSRSRIKDLSNRFSTIDINENREQVEIFGRLISINSYNSFIEFMLVNGETIKIKVKDKSLETVNLTTNLFYKLMVNRIEINDSLGKTDLLYEIKTVKNTELEKPL